MTALEIMILILALLAFIAIALVTIMLVDGKHLRLITTFDVGCAVVIAVAIFGYSFWQSRGEIGGGFIWHLVQNALIGFVGYIVVAWMGHMLPVIGRYLPPNKDDHDDRRRR